MAEHETQEYRGNGNHKWEGVCASTRAGSQVHRLRVPHGWVYKDGEAMVFVPMPDVVKHKV